MSHPPESPQDRLWEEYSAVFRNFDDLTLARWMAQTLGQIEGRVWRLSHPLVAAYRLAATVAEQRELLIQRLATFPHAFPEASCCQAPLLPLFTRDVLEGGLACLHCGETCVPFDDISRELHPMIKEWADKYGPVHEVAHWEEYQRKDVRAYNTAYEEAAQSAERLLVFAGKKILPRLGEHYPAIVWEDNDECLEVRPEDIAT